MVDAVQRVLARQVLQVLAKATVPFPALARWHALDVSRLPPLPVGPPPTPNRDAYPYSGSLIYQGMPILIEQRQGETRSGVAKDGTPWTVTMRAHYGEFADTEGTDGDPIDVYVGPVPDARYAYVVHQKVPGTEVHDEDKVILGVNTAAEAEALYRAQYDRPGFWGGMTRWPIDELRQAIKQRRYQGKRLDNPAWVQKRLEKALARGLEALAKCGCAGLLGEIPQPEGALVQDTAAQARLVDALQGVLVSGVTQRALQSPWTMSADDVVVGLPLYERLLLAAHAVAVLRGYLDEAKALRDILRDGGRQSYALAKAQELGLLPGPDGRAPRLEQEFPVAPDGYRHDRGCLEMNTLGGARFEPGGPSLGCPGCYLRFDVDPQHARRLLGPRAFQAYQEMRASPPLAKARRTRALAQVLLGALAKAGAQASLLDHLARASTSTHTVQQHLAHNPGGGGVHVVHEHIGHHAPAAAPSAALAPPAPARVPFGTYRVTGYQDLRPVDWFTGKRVSIPEEEMATCHRCRKKHAKVVHVTGPAGDFKVGTGCAQQMLEGFDPTGEQFKAVVRAHENEAKQTAKAHRSAFIEEQAHALAAQAQGLTVPAFEDLGVHQLSGGIPVRRYRIGDQNERGFTGQRFKAEPWTDQEIADLKRQWVGDQARKLARGLPGIPDVVRWEIGDKAAYRAQHGHVLVKAHPPHLHGGRADILSRLRTA